MKKTEGIFEDVEERPISINKATIDLLLKQDEPHGLIGLYSFYYYTAIWQKTNQPKSTTSYSAKGLKISEKRIRRYKSKLIELGLIEEVMLRTSDNKKIKGHFIKVKFYKTYPCRNVQGRKSNRVVKRKGNAYRDNNINAYRDNNADTKDADSLFGNPIKKTFYDKCTLKLAKALQKKYKIKVPNKKKWSNQFRLLNTKDGYLKAEIKRVLKWHILHLGESYMIVANCAETFRSKFSKIQIKIKTIEAERSNQMESGEQKTKYTKKKKNRSKK